MEKQIKIQQLLIHIALNNMLLRLHKWLAEEMGIFLERKLPQK